MSAALAVQLALFVLGLVLVVLGLAIGLRRVWWTMADKRRLARQAELKPILLGALVADVPDVAALDAVSGRRRKVLEDLTWSMLTKVRGTSRDVLSQWLADTGAVERERRRTHSRSRIKRAGAAERIGNAGVASTSTDIARLLDDRHEEVRIVAARALGKLGNADAVTDLLGVLGGEKKVPTGIVNMALLHIGPSAVPALIDGLQSPSEWVRAVCADLLGMHGAVAASQVLGSIVESDVSLECRKRAVGSLGRIGNPQSAEVLTQALKDTEPATLRIAAANALGILGGRSALDTLHGALNDSNDQVAETAAQSLARLGRPGTDLLQAVASGDDERAADRASYRLALAVQKAPAYR